MRLPLKLKLVASGLLTYVRSPSRGIPEHTGGTDSARYCYSVWLRHVALASTVGLVGAPGRIAELGPGDSLGIGLAALISGSDQYVGLDIVPYARNDRNLAIFDELVELFRRREAIPGPAEFPDVKPQVGDLSFPHRIFPRDRLDGALAEERIARIRHALEAAGTVTGDSGPIVYLAPWLEDAKIRAETVDFLFSQAVLEHVDPLESTYRAFRRWLHPNGLMSHQIDFRSHGFGLGWNGHWAHSNLTWSLIRGRRPFLLNRRTASCHRKLLRESGFEIVYEQPASTPGGLPRDRLAPRYRNVPDDDLGTSGLYLVARPVARSEERS